MVTIKATVTEDIPPNRLCILSLQDGDPNMAAIELQNGRTDGNYGIPDFNNVVAFTAGQTVTIDTEATDSVWKVEAGGDIEAGELVKNDGAGRVISRSASGGASLSTAGYATQSATTGDIANVIPFAKIDAEWLRASAGGASYTDADAISAINNDADHGTTASHTYFSGNYADLTNVSVTSADISDGTIAEADLSFNAATQSELFSGDYADLTGVSVATGDLAFDPATQGELNTHEGNAAAHHTKTPEFTNADAVSAINGADITPNSVGIATVLNMPATATAPASPTAGDIYVDDGTNTTSGSTGFRYYDGSAWVDL